MTVLTKEIAQDLIEEQGLILNIPDIYTSIDEYAFSSVGKDLISVSIPGSVKDIGAYAFNYCYRLNSVELLDGVERVGDYAFRGNSLTSVEIPDSLISIGEHAFADNNDLTSIDLGNGVKSIGHEAFSRTDRSETGPEDLIIPDSVEVMGSHAFYANYNLASIQISSGLTVIPRRAFMWAYELKSVVIPDGIEVIKDSAFAVSGLEEVIFPASLKEIEDYAFADTSIKEVVLPKGIKKIGTDAFDQGVNIVFVDMNGGLLDLDKDGFVDEVTNYQMWTASGGIDLTNRRGRTYSDDSSRMWDAIKAVETNSGFSVLVEGQRNKDGKFKVATANDEGVVGGTSRWFNGNQMFNEGYEDLFAMDFNGNNQIGF